MFFNLITFLTLQNTVKFVFQISKRKKKKTVQVTYKLAKEGSLLD